MSRFSFLVVTHTYWSTIFGLGVVEIIEMRPLGEYFGHLSKSQISHLDVSVELVLEANP